MPSSSTGHSDQAFEDSKKWQKREDWEKVEAARKRAHEANFVLVKQQDNPGREEWRKRRAAAASITLSSTFQTNAQDACFKPQENRKTDLLAKHFPQLFEVARKYGVQVELRPIFVQGERQGQRLLKLNIFGPVSQAKLAEKEMSIVISELAKLIGQKSEKAAKFAKISAKSDEQKAMEEKDFESYTKAREFCRVPADDAVFARCATFVWPIDSLKAKPQDILGYNFEALDPIRMEQLCHITCDRSKWLFKVQGNDAQNVKEALKRLRGVYFQVIARGVYCETQYLKQPRGATSKPEVELVSTTISSVPGSKKPVGRGTPPKIDLMDAVDDVDSIKSHALKRHRISIINTLSRLQYYNGSLTLRFRLGSFYLTKYMRQDSPTMPRNDFDKMMDNPGIEGEISESFPDGFRQEGLLSGRVPKELQIQTATAFAPIDPDSGRGKQNERAKPATAWTSPDRIVLNEEPPRRYYEPQLSFTIQLKDKDGLVNLDIDYIPDINGHLDQDRCRWSMVPEKRADKKLFDLNYVNVDADTAWNFELTASHAVGEDRLPLLNRFLHQDYFRVKADRKLRLDPNNADLLLALKPLPGLTVMSVHQRKIWKYSILPGEQYRLELACVQPFRAGAVEWSTLRIPLTKKESYWTTHITSGHWSEKLSADGDLGIARSAEWTVTSQDLFPPSNTDADGFAELVTRVDRLAVALKDCIVRPDAAAVAAQPIAPTPSQPAAKAPSQSPAKPPAKTPKKPLPKR